MKKLIEENKVVGAFIFAMLLFFAKDYFTSQKNQYKEFVSVSRYEEFKDSMDEKIGNIDKKLDKLIDRFIDGAK